MPSAIPTIAPVNPAPTAIPPRGVGASADPSSLVPNTRALLPQGRGSDLDTNFLTEDWGRGRDRFGARIGGVSRRINKTPSGGNGNGGNAAASALPPSAPREVLIVLDGTPTDGQINALARRHRLTRIESQALPMIAATVFRWRIPDNRSIATVLRELSDDQAVRSAQPNLRYALQDSGPRPPVEGDPAQYALAKLHLPEAHLLTRGRGVVIAVIDSGIDATHPELAGAVSETFDALNSTEGPHPHGTGIAGIIAAHARLMGSAPEARIVAIRAFGATKSNTAQSTSFVVARALNHAVAQNAQIINMSFSGPRDPLVLQALAAASAHGSLLIAAAGNAGPNSPPLYPAADSHVIAVTATDSDDHLFPAANRGAQIAVAAPGVDILMPAPDGKYQVKSGTSFATAYISGLAALLIDRSPGLTPERVRAAILTTARDLGPKGRDDQFGAGLADALAAVEAVSRSVSAGAAKNDDALPASSR